MTAFEPTKAMSPAFGPGQIVRRHLGSRRLLVGAAILAIVAGAVLNWGWLVALGIAPALLSLLPCLIMCGFGIGCMKMMSGSAQKRSGDGAQTTDLSALGVAKVHGASATPSCCRNPASGAGAVASETASTNR